MAIGVVSYVPDEHRPIAKDKEWSMDLGKLISDAQLDFGCASGTGLGAVLLAIVLIVLFFRTRLRRDG